MATQVRLAAAGGALAAALASLLRHVADGAALRFDVVQGMLPDGLRSLTTLMQRDSRRDAASRSPLLV